MTTFVEQMAPVYLQSDCSGAEGSFYGLQELLGNKCKLISSPLVDNLSTLFVLGCVFSIHLNLF